MKAARDEENFVLCKKFKDERNELIDALSEEVHRFKSSYGGSGEQLIREELERVKSALQTAVDDENYEVAEEMKNKRDELEQKLPSTSIVTSVAKSSLSNSTTSHAGAITTVQV